MNSQALNQRDHRWQQIQAITGLIFALFVFTHLANTFLATAGATAYDSFQEAARQIYQHPVVEILLLAVILPGHILAGVMRARIRRGGVDVRVGPIARAQRWAGWYLVVVIYLHAGAVRLPALLYDVWPRFEGVAFSIEWVPAWFYPYYFLLGLAGLYHGVNGSRIALGRLGLRLRPLGASQAMAIASVGGVAIAVSLLAFGGVWFDVGDPMRSAYGQLYLSLVDQVMK